MSPVDAINLLLLVIVGTTLMIRSYKQSSRIDKLSKEDTKKITELIVKSDKQEEKVNELSQTVSELDIKHPKKKK